MPSARATTSERRMTLPQPTPSDAELLEQIRGGDRDAYRELFHRYATTVYSNCVRILHDAAEAEDVTADVFWEVWNRIDRYDAGRSTPRTYIGMLSRSRAIDRLRSRNLKPEVASDLANSTADAVDSEPTQQLYAMERKELVCTALNELSGIQRSTLELAYFEGLSHREIAETLALPLGTVKSHIRKGLARLQHLLRDIREDER